jgi:hypothetical protein
VEPQNQSQTWVHHPPSKNCGRREFDLDLKFNQRWFKKYKKWKKNVHGVMICDMVPRKKIKHDMPRFHRKLFTKNGTKHGFTWLSTHMTMV